MKTINKNSRLEALNYAWDVSDQFPKLLEKNHGGLALDEICCEVGSKYRSLAFTTLLRIEMELLREQGTCPSRDDYISKFPSYTEEVRTAFREETIDEITSTAEDRNLAWWDGIESVAPDEFSEIAEAFASFGDRGELPDLYQRIKGNDAKLELLCSAFKMPIPGTAFGERENEYLLGNPIALGGQCVVYLAQKLYKSASEPIGAPTNPQATQKVVIKILRPDFARYEEERRAFGKRIDREIYSLADLQLESNIVSLIDAGVSKEGRLPYIVLRFHKHGQTLKDSILSDDSSKKLTPLQLATVGRDFAIGLHAMHSKRYIHRDVKPANLILIDTRGEVKKKSTAPNVFKGKIIDLGLTEPENSNGAVLGRDGTPRYMAPETKEEGSATTRSDIYSLGLSLRQAIPLQNGKPKGGAAKKLDCILRKCTQEKPKNRYQSARDLEKEFDRYLDGKPVKAQSMFAARLVANKIKVPVATFGIAGLIFAMGFLLYRKNVANTLAMKNACPRVEWKLPTELTIPARNLDEVYAHETGNTPQVFVMNSIPEISNPHVKILDDSKLFDLRDHHDIGEEIRMLTKESKDLSLTDRAEQIEKLELRREPAFFTRTIRMRKLRGSAGSNTDFFRCRFETGGLEVVPKAGQNDRIVYYTSDNSKLNHDGAPISTRVADLVVDISELGKDYQPFTITIHAIYWNGFQDQFSGAAAGEWASSKIEQSCDSADLTVFLPSDKKYLDHKGESCLEGGCETGKTDDGEYTSGLVFDRWEHAISWRLPKTEKNRVYKLAFRWK